MVDRPTRGGFNTKALLAVVFGVGILIQFKGSSRFGLSTASLNLDYVQQPPIDTVKSNDSAEKVDVEILIGYSGPTSLDRTEGKNELYLRNFDFFLKHGVDCHHADFAISLTESVERVYHTQLQALQHQDCSHRIYTLVREDESCHDLATVYSIFYNSTIPALSYDYFIYVNCGMTGPSPRSNVWWQPFLDPLSETVKMSGLSVNCFRKNSPHVQSMAYALDRVGLRTVLNSTAIFDCSQQFRPDEVNRFNKIVKRYEQGMSKAILQQGYGLASIVWPGVVFWENRTNCTLIDRWGEANLKLSFGGRLPHLNETIFFKSSRLLPKEIADLIEYPGEPTWHAEWNQLCKNVDLGSMEGILNGITRISCR